MICSAVFSYFGPAYQTEHMNLASFHPQAKPNDQKEVFAGFWIRLMAHNIDLMFLLPVFYLLSFLTPSNTQLYLLCGITAICYEVGFTGSKWGGTPGKQMLKIRVTIAPHENLSLLRSFLRTVLKLLSVFTLFIGYAVIAFHPKKRGLHDIIVGSNVILKVNS